MKTLLVAVIFSVLLRPMKNVFRTSWSAERDATQNNAKALLEYLAMGSHVGIVLLVHLVSASTILRRHPRARRAPRDPDLPPVGSRWQRHGFPTL